VESSWALLPFAVALFTVDTLELYGSDLLVMARLIE